MKVKRIISLLLVLATVLAMGFASAFAEEDVDKLNVTKTITWNTTTDKNKATVTITSNVPEVKNTKVLFVGTLCGAHSLENGTVIDSINAIAQNANVTYYLMNKDGGSGNVRSTPSKAASGTVGQGKTMSETQVKAVESSFKEDSNHSAMSGFISVLTDELGTDPTNFKYDYVVLEFDGTRLAKYAQSPNTATDTIAKVMKSYYDDNRVIWVTDGLDKTKSKEGSLPAKEDYGTLPYVPNNEYYDSTDKSTGHLDDTAKLRTLCSILAPSYYLEHTNASDTTYYGNTSTAFAIGVTGDFYSADARKSSPYCLTPGYKATTGIYADHYAEDSRQMYYKNATDLADFLYMAIKGVTLKFNDAIKIDSDTVKITGVTVSATKNDSITSGTTWTPVCTFNNVQSLDPVTGTDGVKYVEKKETNGIVKVNKDNTGDKADKNNIVAAEAINMKNSASFANSIKFVKVEIELSDEKGFASCIEPKLNDKGEQEYDKDGKPIYVMNPNKGPAEVEAYKGGESTGTAIAKGENPAQAPVVKVYEVLSTVENGTQDYDTKTQKGTKTDTATGIKVSTFEGDNPVLTYKPNTGYIIKSIAIDGTEITLDKDGKYESKVSGKEVEVTTDSSGNVTVKFPNLAADRTVDVKYDTANKKLTFTKTWSDGWTGHDAITINIYVSGSTDVVETVTLDKDNTSKDVYVKAKDASGNPISYVYKEVDKDGNPVEKGSANGNYKFDYTETGSPDVAVAVTNTYIVQPDDMKLGKTAETASESGLAKAGETFKYTLTVTNNRENEGEDAENVVIEDEIPEGLTVTDASADIGTVTNSGRIYTWTIEKLAAEEKATLEITVTVPEGVSAVRYSNQSKLKSLNGTEIPEDYPNPPKSPETNTDVPGFTVTKDVTLKGSKESIAGKVENAGSEVTYSITIKNEHPKMDATTEFVDIVPKGLEVDEKSISNGGTYVESTREITWTGIEVKAGKDITVSFNAKVPDTLEKETEYTNTAFVTKVGEDPEYTGPGSENNNPGEVPFSAAPLYKMEVVKEWSDGWAAHENDTVTVTVKANGEALEDKLTLDKDNTSVKIGYPALDKEGEEIEYSVEEDAVTGYKASYETTPAEEVSGYNVHTITNTYIVKPEDMDLGKKATDTGTAKAGETFKYTLTVTNSRENESEDAENIVIEDEIPEDLEVKGASADLGKVTNVGKVYTWTIDKLAAGEKATLEITVKVPDDAVAASYSNQSKLKSLNGTEIPEDYPKPPKSPEVKTDVRSFEVNKVWLDKEGKTITDTSEMPEVNIVLLRNGARFGAYGCTLSNDNGWSYTFENLWAADADGVAYVYTVEEVPLDKYSWVADYDDDTKSEDFGYTQATVINTTKKVVVDYVFKGKAEDVPDGVVVPDSDTVDYGTEYTAKPTTGYEQYKEQYYYSSGWFTDEGCTQAYVEKTVLDKETAPNGTFTLYGKWERKQVDVEVVKPKDGPDIKYPDPWKKSEGEKPGAKDPVDPNNDYTFKGYYTDPELTKELDPDDPLTKEKYPNGLKLYPKWVKNCVVTYTFEGEDIPQGAVEPDDDKVEPGTEYNSSTEYGKAEGYKFSGWYTDEKLTNKYIEGTVLEENMDLFGKWSAINDYTVSKDVKFNNESIKDGSIYSGNTVTYTIDVTNNNTAVAMTAEVVDKVPAGLTIVQSSISYPESCVVTGNTLTWTLIMAPGETKKLSYNATIPADLEAASEFSNKAYVSKSNGDPYKPDVENPKPGTPENPAVVKFTGVPVKIITFTKVWSDTWDNHSSVVINLYANEVLKDSIYLDNGEHKSETRYLNAYDAAGNPINYTYREVYSDTDVGKGEMNGKYLFDYTETAEAEKATVDVKVTNTYQIGPEDLEFNKTADGQAVAGSTFTYTLTVKNTRAHETAANVIVVDTIPEGLEVTGWTEGATVAFEGQVCTWTIAQIAPEETATLQITVKVPDGTVAAEYTNQAEITNIGETPVPPGIKPSPEAKTTVRSFTVTKVWDERVKKEDRPSVTVTLMQNDKKYGDSVILSGDKLSNTWDKLPLRDEKGVPYAYTVVEDKIEGFTAEINYTGEPSVYGNAAAEITNTLKTITVSYQYLGEDKPSGKPLPETAYVEYGSKYDSAQKPEADYYEFSGWYTDVECKNLYVDGTVLNDTTVPTGSMVLYGKWTRKTATVTPFYIDKPEGIKVPDPVTLKQGDKYTPPEAPTVTGYEFGGWYSDPECTKEYKGGIVTGDMAVYGKWHKLVNVTYSYTGSIPSGATVPTSASMRKGTAYTAAATPSVSGYTFSGWYTDSGCTQLYANGTAINADTVLYGKWTKNSSGGTTTSDTVKTGDNSNAGTYVIIALATSACIGGTIAVSNYRKKKKEQ